MPSVPEALTRKLGPLPTYAWGAVVGGAVLGVKLLRGGGGGASSAAVQSVGGDGADLPTPSSGGGFDFSGGETPVAGGDPIGGLLPGIIDSLADFSGFAALQQQLSSVVSALDSKRATLAGLLTTKESISRQLGDLLAKRRDGKISAAEYDKQKAALNAKLTTTNTSITKTNAEISTLASQQTSLQKQIAAIFAAPAAA